MCFFGGAHYKMHSGRSCALSLVLLVVFQSKPFLVEFHTILDKVCTAVKKHISSPSSCHCPFQSQLTPDPQVLHTRTHVHTHPPMQTQFSLHLVTVSDHGSPSWVPSTEPPCRLWAGADPTGE